MPLVTLKTMKGKPAQALHKTMRDINAIVAENLGYDPSHVFVFAEEVEDEHFMTAGKTWAELKPHFYPEEVN